MRSIAGRMPTFALIAVLAPLAADAQETRGPSPGGDAGAAQRAFRPGPLGGSTLTERFLMSSAANERASFLWVIDSVDRMVILCEKGSGAEFSCSKKPLP
jgi:hypothetical protein